MGPYTASLPYEAAPANAVAAKSWNSSPMQLRLTTDSMRAREKLIVDGGSGLLSLLLAELVDGPTDTPAGQSKD